MPEYFTAMGKLRSAGPENAEDRLVTLERTEAKQCLLNIRAGRAEPATTDAYGDIQAGERAIYCMSENRGVKRMAIGYTKSGKFV